MRTVSLAAKPMKIRKSFAIVISVNIMLLVCLPAHAFAAVRINEVVVHPGAGNDWIELYNPDGVDIDLSGWRIHDSGSSPLKTVTGVLPAVGFLVVEVTNRLNNTGDVVMLVDAGSTVIDSYTYTKDPGIDVSVGRFPDGVGEIKPLHLPSKHGPNASVRDEPVPAVSSTPSLASQTHPTAAIGGVLATTQVSLSEIFPAPKPGEDEWVELYNSTDQEVSVAGWQIDDGEGGSAPFTIPHEGNSAFIPPKSYKVYVITAAKFNNSGDTVRLLRPDATIAEQISFQAIGSGVSLAKDQTGAWHETTTPTPTQANAISALPQATAKAVSSTSAPKPVSSSILGTSTQTGTQIANLGNTAAGGQMQSANLNQLLPNLTKTSTKITTPSATITPHYQKWSTGHLMQYSIGTACLVLVGAAFFFLKRFKHEPT